MAKNQTVVQNNQVVAEQVEESVNVVANVFDSMFEESVNDVKTKDDIIKELLADKNCKKVTLHVKNVTSTVLETHAFLTFVVKEFVIGDVRDDSHVNAFGEAEITLGKTHNVQVSSFALSSTMKENAKTAIYANDVVERPSLANDLFAGGIIDVIMQFVPANTDYINPFASNPEPTRFERDKVLHHIIRAEVGEVGRDMYMARISRI